MSWICCLIVPFCTMFYCHVRTLWDGYKSLHIFTVEGATSEDIYVTKVLACVSLATCICDVPFYGVNLAAGLGTYVPRDAIFTSHFLLFFSWTLPWLIFTLTSTSQLATCCSCACVCDICPTSDGLSACSTSAEQRKRNRMQKKDVEHVQELESKRGLLSSVTSATNSPALSVNSSVVRQRDLETVL